MGRRRAIPEIRSPKEGGGEGAVTFLTKTSLVKGWGTPSKEQLLRKG